MFDALCSLVHLQHWQKGVTSTKEKYVVWQSTQYQTLQMLWKMRTNLIDVFHSFNLLWTKTLYYTVVCSSKLNIHCSAQLMLFLVNVHSSPQLMLFLVNVHCSPQFMLFLVNVHYSPQFMLFLVDVHCSPQFMLFLGNVHCSPQFMLFPVNVHSSPQFMLFLAL